MFVFVSPAGYIFECVDALVWFFCWQDRELDLGKVLWLGYVLSSVENTLAGGWWEEEEGKLVVGKGNGMGGF
jgi:hypothetical protein